MRCLLIVLLLASCAPEEEAGPAPGTCEPGRSVACPCDDGSMATQTCKSDGTGWNECRCDEVGDECSAHSDCESGALVCVSGACVPGTLVQEGGDCSEPNAICASTPERPLVCTGFRTCAYSGT